MHDLVVPLHLGGQRSLISTARRAACYCNPTSCQPAGLCLVIRTLQTPKQDPILVIHIVWYMVAVVFPEYDCDLSTPPLLPAAYFGPSLERRAAAPVQKTQEHARSQLERQREEDAVPRASRSGRLSVDALPRAHAACAKNPVHAPSPQRTYPRSGAPRVVRRSGQLAPSFTYMLWKH